MPESREGEVGGGVGVSTGRRILVVEDDHDAREAMRALLELVGHHVETAEDGQGALDAVREARPDIALIDIGLPGMDGYELARHLRATAEGRTMCLIALTGLGVRGEEPGGLARGFDAHLVKPVDLEELSGVIARMHPPACG